MHYILRTALLFALACSGAVHASPGPQPLPAVSAIAAPRDIPFRGVMTLDVDATDTVHKIFRVRQTIPVQQPGAMVLLYPQWETSSHSATLEAAPLAGLMITAGGRPVIWRRDAADPFAFHVTVPAGARALDITFDYLPAMNGPKLISPAMLMLPWSRVALYPAGWFIRNVLVQANLTVPPGFAFASALDTASVTDNRIVFITTSFEDLADAPVYAGLHVKRYDLAAPGAVPVRLDLFGDTDAALDIPPALLDHYRAVADGMPRLFRSRHYRHFDFLMSLSDVMTSGGGVEHQESTEINLPAGYFTDATTQLAMANLVVHEFAHAWNGRTRQPADLWEPNLNLPVGGSLLWLYEGQSEFWATVMTPRFGLQTAQQSMDALAVEAAKAVARPGRQWKSLQDSTIDALYMPGRPVNWRDWQRREDYYGEGVLLWLDVDMILREQSGGKASLFDFAATFFGPGANTRLITTYTFDDVCRALHKLAPYDWAGYFTARLNAHDDTHVLDGLRRAGYRLVYTGTPTESFVAHEADLGAMDLSLSLGLAVGKGGVVKSVAWQSPAFRSGISLGAKLTAVGAAPYSDAALKEAMRANTPLTLSYFADGAAHTVTITDAGPLRYPRLERIMSTVDRLQTLLTAPL
jgi:predicted metalloprotease with PDZ domain